jgi:hypothetical protein
MQLMIVADVVLVGRVCERGSAAGPAEFYFTFAEQHTQTHNEFLSVPFYYKIYKLQRKNGKE